MWYDWLTPVLTACDWTAGGLGPRSFFLGLLFLGLGSYVAR